MLLLTGGRLYSLKGITLLVNSDYGVVYDLLQYLKLKSSNFSALAIYHQLSNTFARVKNSFLGKPDTGYTSNVLILLFSWLIVIWPALFISKLAVNTFSDHIFLKYPVVNWLLFCIL